MIDYDKLITDYLKEVDEKVKVSDNNVEGNQQKLMIYTAANVFRDLMKRMSSEDNHN